MPFMKDEYVANQVSFLRDLADKIESGKVRTISYRDGIANVLPFQTSRDVVSHPDGYEVVKLHMEYIVSVSKRSEDMLESKSI